MDKVFIEALEIDCVIGIYDWERTIRQPVQFDIEMEFDNRVPAASDRIEDTLDYKAVSKRLIQFVSESSYGLVETLAGLSGYRLPQPRLQPECTRPPAARAGRVGRSLRQVANLAAVPHAGGRLRR